METRANHVLVGLFVLLLGIGAIAFAIWIAALQADRQVNSYLLVFDGAVTGLSTGSSVNYEGVPVGQVMNIDLSARDPGRVRVTISIDADTPVRRDTVATLELAGLTGGRYVQLSGGSADAPLPRRQNGETLPQLQTRASPIEQVLAGAPDIITALNSILLRTEAILSEENTRNVEVILQEGAATMGNINDTSAVVADLARDLRSELGVIMPKLESTFTAVEGVATNIDAASREAQPTLAEFRQAARSVDRLANDLNGLVEENRRPLSDFTNSGLGELSSLLGELRRLAGNLNQISNDLQSNPAGFLLGVPPDGYRPSND
ncbi:MlaD family protein [Aquibaculum arenosum]|uniref:MlaD family protein n=1 Tax=Aquibaculum arenosum TaxID=3032591 RepID=A0ABT5YHZ9_9PROT|nr:MlaD family protein [Fodinicurvata sp. CAU 1616]MDF2094564.1 MlaD family protein [Fodinicurvata sp. CAU 1616]